MKNQSTKKLGFIMAIMIVVIMVGFFMNKSKSIHPNISVANVNYNQAIASPLLIVGEARGTWFFEADFPIFLEDEEGNQIAVAIAHAQNDWMTEDFVPYKAKLEFNVEEDIKGILVFKKDNPSDLPEYDDELRIPVYIEAK
ncbi:hypothetical protein JW758_01655 [Candidatus Peregrinibacteria bacterium]|nr:hypothetical protein [Candidatus Peregrinibacteria bacterium]